MAYIHYGHKQFDRGMFQKPRNSTWQNKPVGGLWASAEGAEYGWKAWCEIEDFRVCREDNAFRFELAPTANILCIHSVAAERKLPLVDGKLGFGYRYYDFEKLVANGVDVIDFRLSADRRLYWEMYGWDCDCILVLNPDVVIPCGGSELVKNIGPSTEGRVQGGSQNEQHHAAQ